MTPAEWSKQRRERFAREGLNARGEPRKVYRPADVQYLLDQNATLRSKSEPLERVAKAWHDAGPFPSMHQDFQEFLRRRWPTLADALDELEKP